MKSLIKKLFEDEPLVSGTASSEIKPQRIFDEDGAIQITFNQAVGASADGKIVVEAALSEEAAFTVVATFNFTDAAFQTSPFSVVTTQVIYPRMRVSMQPDTGPSFTPNANTTVSVWIQE